MISPDTNFSGTDDTVANISPSDASSPLPETRSPKRHTTAQLEHGQLCLARLEAVLEFRRENPALNWKAIKKATGVSSVEFCRWKCRLSFLELTLQSPRSELVAALAKSSPPGRKPKYALTETEASKVQAHNLQSNRTATAGSPQEALKHAMKRGEIGESLRRHLQQREADGKPLLTAAMLRQVRIGEMEVRTDRTPRGAWLQYVTSPGSLQLTIDEATGEERMYQPGEAWTIDDGTINFVCCVPLEKPGDKCWDKYGCMVGRFQFIVIADHRSYFIPGFSYTARPRGSYRAEDLTSTIHIAARQHGIPKKMFLEHGVSASRLVHETLTRAGIQIKHVKSPHQKVVESLFNKLWTKLSFLPGQVGRHMGDDEETTKLMMSCRGGYTDPRKHFLMLDDVVKALRDAIEDHNGSWINGSRYGRWMPREFWSAKAPAILRPLDVNSEWMFSPVIAAGKPPMIGLAVNGFRVKTTVPLMEGMSQVFHFGADWLQAFHGARVKLFFNPFVDAPAKVVLAADFQGTKADTVLGDAEMIDRQARFNLRKLGYGAFPDIGLAAARSHAQALRRAVVAIRPDGKTGVVSLENRSMPNAVVPNQNTAPDPTSRFLRGKVGLGVEQDEFDRQSARLERAEQRSRNQQPVFIEE
jgi:hypothetical protein